MIHRFSRRSGKKDRDSFGRFVRTSPDPFPLRTSPDPFPLRERPIPDDWRIPDDLWEAIAPLLPEHKNTHRFGGGRPRKPDRVCMEAIRFVLRTGCQWKALDATKFCPASTAHDRFQEWVQAGVFQDLWEHGLMAYDDWKEIDWSWLSMDGCMTKAPLGGEKDGEKPHRPGQEGHQAQSAGRGRGYPGRVGRGRCQPSRHENGRRHPRQHPDGASQAPTPEEPQGLCLDLGYDYDEVQEIAEEFDFTTHLPPQKGAAQQVKRKAGHKARRWVVERTHSWMNRFRGVLVRWSKKAENYIALLHLSFAFIIYGRMELTG